MAEIAVPLATPQILSRREWPPVLVILSLAVVAIVLVFLAAGESGLLGDPQVQDLTAAASAPSGEHLLGTDQLGRDVWARIIAGTRPAVAGPLVVALGTVTIGAVLGMLAALRGGVIDSLTGRYVELVMALPGLLLVIVLVSALGGGYPVTIGIFIFLLVPGAVRLTRSATLSQIRLPYLDAARTMGLSTQRVLGRYLLPNILPTVLATALIDFVGALVGFSSLSYLGLGVTVGTPDWGRMLAEGRPLLLRNPWAAVAPASAIVMVAASVTILGDWLYERLSSR